MENNKTLKFNKSEVFAIFVLFLICGILLFSIGIIVGKKILEKDCQIIISETEKNLEDCKNSKENIKVTELETNKKEEKKEIIKPDYSYLAITETTEDIKGKYTIQVASFTNEVEAQEFAHNLYNSGYKSTYYTIVNLLDKGTWYRVSVGFFKEYSSAEIFAKMLEKQGKIETYIIRKI